MTSALVRVCGVGATVLNEPPPATRQRHEQLICEVRTHRHACQQIRPRLVDGAIRHAFRGDALLAEPGHDLGDVPGPHLDRQNVAGAGALAHLFDPAGRLGQREAPPDGGDFPLGDVNGHVRDKRPH